MDEYNCTICLEEINKDALKVCNCKNTVHIHCLLEWINHKNTTTCEICNSQYKIPEDILNEYLGELYVDNNYSRENIEEDIDIENIEHIGDNQDIDDTYEQYNRRRQQLVCTSYKIIVCIILPFMGGFISFIIYLLYTLYNTNRKSQEKNN